eukprot:PhM_4_TR13559/c0_g1_i1/m.87162
MKTYIILIILAVITVSDRAHAEDSVCTEYNACNKCVFDAYSYDTRESHNCGWDVRKDTCIPITSDVLAMNTNDTLITSSMGHNKCGELKCTLAHISANVYACSPFSHIMLVLDLLALVWCVLHFGWVRTMARFPWRYGNIHEVVEHHLRNSMLSCLILQRKSRMGAMDGVYEMDQQQGQTQQQGLTNDSRLLDFCSMCRVPSAKPFRHGKVCPWCSVIRLSSIPLLIGYSTSLLSIFMLVSLSVRPAFDVPFKVFLFLLRVCVFVVYYIFVVRQLRKTTSDASMHVGLYILLLKNWFRDITCLNVPNVIHLVPVFIQEKNGKADEELGDYVMEEFITPVEVVDVPNAFQQSIRHTIPVVHWGEETVLTTSDENEFVLWYEKPLGKAVMIEQRHLLQGSACLVIASFSVFLLGVVEELPLHGHISRSSLLTLGVIGVFVFVVVFALILSSCDRLHVVTTRRIITYSMGVFGGVYMSAQDLKDVCCAAIHSYTEHSPMTIVSFQHPRIAGRRLPPLPTSRFVCVRDVPGLMGIIRTHAPPLHPEHWKEYMETLRQEYRCIMFAAMISVQAMFLVYYYEVIPVSTVTVMFIAAVGLCATAVHRGVRIHLTTTQVIRNEKPWSSWRMPAWRVRRPEAHGHEVEMDQSRPQQTMMDDVN